MKKNILAIYIIMIVVGVIGILYYSRQSGFSTQVKQKISVPEETIAVAVANRDLKVNTVLQDGHFQMKNIKTFKNSTDYYFNMTEFNPVNWALKTPISAGSYIPPKSLVSPDSDEYLEMLIKPGNVLYPFALEEMDKYLLTNLMPGQGVDIYLSYSIQGDSGEILSPSHSIRDSRLKPLMINKRVLSIQQKKMENKIGMVTQKNDGHLLIELQHNEVKILRELEDKKAKLLIFPTVKNISIKTQETNTTLQKTEADWPVSNEVIFNKSPSAPEVIPEVYELRG